MRRVLLASSLAVAMTAITQLRGINTAASFW